MKATLLTFLFTSLLLLTQTFAQDKYFTRNGQISFFSSTPLEDIDAKNDHAISVLDARTGKLEFAVLMKGFKFKKALMEEHFNENYVESDRFPKASFVGAITNMEEVDLKKDGTYHVQVKGKLTIHGVTREVEAPGTIIVQNGAVKANSEFIVAPEDYKIEIPKLVRENIAKQVKVTVKMEYLPLKS